MKKTYGGFNGRYKTKLKIRGSKTRARLRTRTGFARPVRWTKGPFPMPY